MVEIPDFLPVNAEDQIPVAVYRLSVELLWSQNDEAAIMPLQELDIWLRNQPETYVYPEDVVGPAWGKEPPERAFGFDFEVAKMHSQYGLKVINQMAKFILDLSDDLITVVEPKPAKRFRKRWLRRG